MTQQLIVNPVLLVSYKLEEGFADALIDLNISILKEYAKDAKFRYQDALNAIDLIFVLIVILVHLEY